MISFTSFIQEFYQSLPREIAKNSGYEVKVLVPPYWKELWSGGKKYLEKTYDPNYEIIVGKILFPGNLHFTLILTKLAKVLKSFKPHIIDLEDEPFNAGSFQIFRYKKIFSPNSKLILHASQHQYKNYPPPFSLMECHVLKNVDAILVRNSMAHDVLIRKGFKGKIELITHGVDTEAFKPRAISNNGNDIPKNDKPIIGYVGSLVGHKGVDLLLKSVQGLECKLLIIGDGSEKPNLILLAKQMKIDAQFIPAVSHKEVAHYMNVMDIFVLPSLTRPNWIEKFGRVLIEAMAAGVAVIGSNSGEIPNVLGEAGIIFKEGDIYALREKILLLLKDKHLRYNLARKGRERTLKHYSWNAIARRTIEVYKDVLETN